MAPLDDQTADAIGCLLGVFVRPWLFPMPWLARHPSVWILSAAPERGTPRPAHWATSDGSRADASASVARLADHLASGGSIAAFGVVDGPATG